MRPHFLHNTVTTSAVLLRTFNKFLNRRKDKMYKECWNERQQVSVRSTG